ncbi:hypothetical protein BJ741DRAFT_625076 [Chytriomyces cf. hyalinus JEL632]|nr:hypothetical protein BJ741DRAFT_625076 [Chytriomyces cf. hyalinus JEL632]
MRRICSGQQMRCAHRIHLDRYFQLCVCMHCRILQTVLFVAVGAVADHLSLTQVALGDFCLHQYWLAALLFIVMNVFASGAWAFLYAYLLILARSHVDYLTAAQATPASTDSLHRAPIGYPLIHSSGCIRDHSLH